MLNLIRYTNNEPTAAQVKWLALPARALVYKHAKLSISLLLCLCLCLCSQSSFANYQGTLKPIVLFDNQKLNDLGKHTLIFYDTNKRYQLNQITQADLLKQFTPSKQNILNFGFSTGAYWAMLDIVNPSNLTKQQLLEIAYPLLDQVSVYALDTQALKQGKLNIVEQWHLGDTIPFNARPLPHVHFVFPLEFEPQQRLTIVINASSDGPVTVPINLYSETQFLAHNTVNQIISGLFYGILLAMIFYNLFIFFSTTDTSYLYYVHSISSQLTFAFVIDGHANQYWFANTPEISAIAPSIMMCWSCISAILFCQRFLQLKLYMPVYNRFLNLVCYSLLSFLIALYFFSPEKMIAGMVSTAVFVLPALVVAVVTRIREGFHPAQYLLLAWSVPVIGFSLRALASFDIIPSNTITLYCGQIGIAIEVIVLSLALADRIKVLQKEAKIKDQLAKDNAEKANHSKSIFIANVSHEIRTPLNIILGYSQMIARSPNLTPNIHDKVEVIENSGQHLLKLINDILDISKIEANAMTINYNDFDLTELTNGLSIMFGGRCDVKKLKWKFTNDCQQPTLLHGDIGKLRQILINLLGNAVKFTSEGFIHLKLSSPQPHHYLFEVIDTGIGIDPKHIGEIFRAFGQTNQGSTHGGTGLGLAIAYQQIKLLGGMLTCRSELNKGSHFQFTIKMEQAKNSIVPRIKRQHTIQKLPRNIHLTALVVDDVKENRNILCHILQEAGLEVSQASNGKEALSYLHQVAKLPDIVFLDIRMPEMDGVEALRHIKQDFVGKCPICVVITAHALRHDVDYYLKQGFDHYIAKPFRFEAVFDCIHHLMGVDFECEHEHQQTISNDKDEQQASKQNDSSAPNSYHNSNHRHSEAQPTTQLPKQVMITDELFNLIIISAQDHEMAKLNQALEQLAIQGPEAQMLVQVLHQYVLQYDMTGLIQRLRSVRVKP